MTTRETRLGLPYSQTETDGVRGRLGNLGAFFFTSLPFQENGRAGDFKHPMKVAVVAAEMVPYAKVGGLADVIGSLPEALAAERASVSVVLPGYRSAIQKLKAEQV